MGLENHIKFPIRRPELELGVDETGSLMLTVASRSSISIFTVNRSASNAGRPVMARPMIRVRVDFVGALVGAARFSRLLACWTGKSYCSVTRAAEHGTGLPADGGLARERVKLAERDLLGAERPASLSGGVQRNNTPLWISGLCRRAWPG